jgi:hypothetical protein
MCAAGCSLRKVARCMRRGSENQASLLICALVQCVALQTITTYRPALPNMLALKTQLLWHKFSCCATSTLAHESLLKHITEAALPEAAGDSTRSLVVSVLACIFRLSAPSHLQGHVPVLAAEAAPCHAPVDLPLVLLQLLQR